MLSILATLSTVFTLSRDGCPLSRIGIAMRRWPDYSTAEVVRSDVPMDPALKVSVVPWRELRADSWKEGRCTHSGVSSAAQDHLYYSSIIRLMVKDSKALSPKASASAERASGSRKLPEWWL